MTDNRKLNKIFPHCSGLNWHIYGIIGSGKRKEEVFLEKYIKFEDVEYLLQKWNKKIGVLWEVLKLNKDGVKTSNCCPSCGDDNEKRFTNYLDKKYKPLDGSWTPYMSDFGGSGWISIRCQKCGKIFNMDISS